MAEFDQILEQAKLIQGLGKSIKWFVVKGAYHAIEPYSKRIRVELDKLLEMIKEKQNGD